MVLDRRAFLKGVTLAGAAGVLGGTAAGRLLAEQEAPARAAAPGDFDFIFFTDTHIEPELNAPQGCESCFRKIAKIKSDFAIMGGDHVYDATAVGRDRAKTVFDLYGKAEDLLEMPVHHVIGNHDPFGISVKSGVATADAEYGKKMYEQRIGGKTYYSFDHKGYHFVVLDSIQPTEDRLWDARIDNAQLAWLEDDLKKAGTQTPVIAAVHVPLVTAFTTFAGERIRGGDKYSTLSVGNASEVLRLFAGHNVLAVLQGHTHVNEIVQYRGIQFITSGAVCGNWWHGPRMGVPEGFTVASLRGGKITTRYETYGFHSIDVREKF
jgi:Icc protein